jgi:8-oxo-dGTP pyrophosphatase MutT (NUDIX family)
MTPTKACPVVLRNDGPLQTLAFQHPLAGNQLVKGTIEPGEQPREAALRELKEESGLCASGVAVALGIWVPGYQGQVWSFHLCSVPGELPDRWVHHTEDGGGLAFNFFWHPLAAMSRPSGFGYSGTRWPSSRAE